MNAWSHIHEPLSCFTSTSRTSVRLVGRRERGKRTIENASRTALPTKQIPAVSPMERTRSSITSAIRASLERIPLDRNRADRHSNAVPSRKEAKMKGRAGSKRPEPSRARVEPAVAERGNASRRHAPGGGGRRARRDPLPADAPVRLGLERFDPGRLARTEEVVGGRLRTLRPGPDAACEWLVGAGQPALYHATSLLLYAIATWLVYRTARRLGARPWLAFGTALLFGAHPAHVEAVAYVSGRSDLLATACALGALAIARSARRVGAGRFLVVARLAGVRTPALALLSNEVALATPFRPGRRCDRVGARRRRPRAIAGRSTRASSSSRWRASSPGSP